MRFNKKGDEFVEAAIVLPLVILISIAIIVLCIHFYKCLEMQVDMHEELNYLYGESEIIFEEASSIRIVGETELTAERYIISETKILRASEFLDI